ncbi:MAG: nucleotidyltransferase family protein [Chloroflexi bacterium]|nr:nucleotidyltransferase family protein [Chloroflexota bacterium]
MAAPNPFNSLPESVDSRPPPPFAWAAVPFGDDAAATLRSEVARDPGLLVEQAMAAELGALLCGRLERCALLERLPADGLAALHQERRRTLAENVVFLAELDAALDALADAGVQIVLLKGAALLAAGVFAAAERPMSDLDLLVAAADLTAIETVLDRLGYRRDPARAAAFEARYAGQYAFVREAPAGRCWIDVHRALFAVDWLQREGRTYEESCRRRARPLPDRTAAGVLDPADQAVHVCLHWALHHGLGGVWPAVDLAATVCQDGFRWELFAERAKESGWPAAVFLALRRATVLAGLAVHDDLLSMLVPGAFRRAMLGWLFPAGTAVLPPTSAAQATRFLHLAAAEPREALRLIGRALWPEGEWLALRYGGAGRRLSYLARLARLTLQAIRQMTRPG